MITLGTRRVMLAMIIASVASYGHHAAAAEPTLTDVAACNQRAAEQTGASALPAPPGAPGKELTQRAPDGTREPRELPAHGGVPVAQRAEKPEKTDPTGSFIDQSPDPLLQGMAADRADDPAYRTAYRECMRAKTAR